MLLLPTPESPTTMTLICGKFCSINIISDQSTRIRNNEVQNYHFLREIRFPFEFELAPLMRAPNEVAVV